MDALRQRNLRPQQLQGENSSDSAQIPPGRAGLGFPRAEPGTAAKILIQPGNHSSLSLQPLSLLQSLLPALFQKPEWAGAQELLLWFPLMLPEFSHPGFVTSQSGSSPFPVCPWTVGLVDLELLQSSGRPRWTLLPSLHPSKQQENPSRLFSVLPFLASMYIDNSSAVCAHRIHAFLAKLLPV